MQSAIFEKSRLLHCSQNNLIQSAMFWKCQLLHCSQNNLMQSAIFQESAVALQFDEYPHSKLMDSVFYQIDKGISVYFWQHCCFIMLIFLAWCIWTLLIGETYPVWIFLTVVNLPTVPLSVFPTMGRHPKNDVPNTLTRLEQHWRMKRKKRLWAACIFPHVHALAMFDQGP